MASLLLKARMALELPHINRALENLAEELPAPAKPAARHTLMAGGKRLRPLLTVLFARLFGAGGDGKDSLYRLACTLEMLHCATLMHDDVIDNADKRRGKPAAHVVFDNTTAILAGDAMLSTANACVAEYNDPELCQVFARATAETTAGEILELNALRNTELSGREYTDIIRGKTARLIRAACEMGALYAKASPEQVRACALYGECTGLAFQIVDDALDVADADATGKPSGGDLREGKLTPPLQLYRDTLDEAGRREFNEKFTGGTFSEEEIASVCAKIRTLGIDRAVRHMADAYLDQALSALDILPKGSERGILEEILTYVRDRKK